MTVIQLFGGASASPPTPFEHPASKRISSGRPNCAQEIADRSKAWIDEAMAAREGLTPAQRRDLADRHMQQVIWTLDDRQSPLCMTVVGKHAWFARILTAED